MIQINGSTTTEKFKVICLTSLHKGPTNTELFRRRPKMRMDDLVHDLEIWRSESMTLMSSESGRRPC